MTDQTVALKEGDDTPPPPVSLPPPPKIVGSGVAAGGQQTAQFTQASPSPPLSIMSSLPPPPTLNTIKAGVGGDAPTSITTGYSLPPPPTVISSSLPPPPTLNSDKITATGQGGESSTKSGGGQPPKSPSSNSPSRKTTTVHSTNEQIPTLASAPNSGAIAPQYIDSMIQQQQTQIGAPTNNNNEQSTTTQQTEMIPQQSQQQSQPNDPSSGNSWTSWATSNVSSNLPAGTSTLLEKASQLAYTAAESASHIASNAGVVGVGGGIGGGVTAVLGAGGVVGGSTAASYFNHDEKKSNSNANLNVNAEGLSMIGVSPGVDMSPGVDNKQQIESTSGAGGSAKQDNFANLFISSPTESNKMAHESSQDLNQVREERTDSKLPSEDMMMMMPIETPDTSDHPTTTTTATATSSSTLATDAKEYAAELQSSQQQKLQQQHQQIQQQQRAAANPPSSTLAQRQTDLSVLILPTAEAKTIASRNNTTLSDMFRIYGNTKSPPNNKTAAGGGKVDTTLEPMLPPFRSANRSMALSWDNIILNFVSNEVMDSKPISENVMERGLSISARLWDEDMSPEEKEKNVDKEMDLLEDYVVNALAEDEEEERVRKEDGIPSMTSLVPSSSSQHNNYHLKGDDGETSDHQRGREPFPPRPEEILESCADAAFALTTHPTKTSYLRRFRHTLDCATDGMSHEMLNNPSVVILVASTSEYTSYVNCLAELANVHHLPRPYHDGRYDPNGLRREFLLLHDVINGPKDFDENVALSAMRERFGHGCCSVLKINSLVPRPPGSISDGYGNVGEDEEWESGYPCSPFVQNNLSGEYTTSLATLKSDTSSKPNIRGVCLSPSDKRAIRRYVANMVATGLVPAIERRIAHLNATVTNAKKGVKNVIKSFWRKPKENILVNVSGYNDNSGGASGGENNNQGSNNDNASTSIDGGGANSSSSGNLKYRYDSIESQTRLLADTLFLMRDYEAALSVYRLVKDDYKHDKAHLHYASVQEMMVLCMHCLDASINDGRYSHDMHHSIETALYSYTRASDEEKESDASSGVSRPGKAPYATRLATRLCLALSAARSVCEGKHMEIADLLASASSHETPLGAAILLEQSSMHYYRAGMLRKYAFHMLMAGHMFRSASQERHAFRCFAASLYVYHGERWGELRSHLRSALAAQLFGMGRFALSMQFYAKLIGMVGGGRVSVRSQQKFLNHIVSICNEHQSAAVVAIDRINQSGSIEGSAARGIDDVMKSISDATRQIEMANIGFPAVQDSSVRVRIAGGGESCVSLGRSDSLISAEESPDGKGNEAVWQDLMNCTEAEWRASTISSPTVDDSSKNDGNLSSHEDNDPSTPLAHSGYQFLDDQFLDSVITEIDKEERDMEYRERQKRKGGVRTPEVRATSEPLSVTFSLKNPLGLDIELMDMQLVASFSCPKSGLVHTNEFSVTSKDYHSQTVDKKNWKFHGSSHQFQSPEFMYQHPIDSTDTSSSEASVIDEKSDPYFVVAKSSMKLSPNSDAMASLKICPLVEGELKILGVRFHLLGEIWIYHQFDLPGPLLQNTRDNKSRRGKVICYVELIAVPL